MSSGAITGVDERWMSLALSLGRRGQGQVWPNPAVGCVIVKDGRVLGRGWTASGGRPHAETIAIAQAGPAAKGATAYVSLEPCAHTGQTPPCAQALIKSGVARVVVALEDPDPRVAGKGLADLKAADIEVVSGVLADQARRDHQGFLSRVTQGRPMITLKLAMSLDGRIATSTGESQWITGPEARRAVHAMRTRHDAVMVGAGTARADMPSLTVRDLGVAQQPVRVVLSSTLDLPQHGPLAETAKDSPVWLLHGEDAPTKAKDFWTKAGAVLMQCETDATGALSIESALQALGAAGLTRVFCEGGGSLAASLLNAGMVDNLAVFSAGMALGADGLAGVAPLGLDKLVDAQRFELAESRQLGADLLHLWHRS